MAVVSTRPDIKCRDDPLDLLSDVVTAVVPARIVNAVIFVSPVWMGRPEFAAATVGIAAVISWAGVELWWRLPPLGVRWPVYRTDE